MWERIIIKYHNKYVFRRIDTGRIKINKMALLTMSKFIQLSPDATEAGGVLLGRFILDSDDIVIDNVIIPHKKDRRSRHCFIRDKHSHHSEIVRYWKESNGTCNYLGEWHTHPESLPEPSPKDICNWKRILRQAVFDSESLFFIILGTKQLKAWEGLRESLEIKLLATEI
ncbi:MAG TPA: hypothetical protein DF698_02510 [Candidatus Atribacteria bacterium]|nr:hypothetical protein [Candidatus Atribacteria bacterium]